MRTRRSQIRLAADYGQDDVLCDISRDARARATGGIMPRSSSDSTSNSNHVRVTVRSPLSDTPTVFHKFHFNMTLERKKRTPLLRLSAGPTLVNSGHGPDRSLARARARPPMRAVPQCRTRVSSRRSSGYQEPQWVTRGLSALHKQPRPPLRCETKTKPLR